MSRRGTSAALLAAGLLVGAIAAQPNSWHSADGGLVHSSAIVRLGSGPYLHTNSAHTALDIERIELDASGNLVVYRDYPTGAKIAACIAEEDESLVKLGVAAGCSGGGKVSTIYLYDRNGYRVRADDARFGTNANLWLYWLSFIPPTPSE